MNRILCTRQLGRKPPLYFTAIRCSPTPQTAFFRRTTSTVGVNKTGFIEKAPGESLLYFDNVYPLKTAIYDIRDLMMRYDRNSVASRVEKQFIPPSLRNKASAEKFTITSITPRNKDGGAFVKFLSNNPIGVEACVQEYLKWRQLRPWFSPFRRVRSFLVRGDPWLEDLQWYPSTRLRVECVGGEGLGQEAIYALFRRYGKIADISVSPPGSKDLPKSVTVQYLRIGSATSARNCLHGFAVPEIPTIGGKEGGTTLRILYERTPKVRWIRDWVVSHPRIILPLIAAIITTVAVWVFDPIRTWSIKAKITHSLYFSENQYWGWVKKHTVDHFIFGRSHELEDLSALWAERKDSVDKINGWLEETEETFIVVHGPRGSGKRELVVESVLGSRKNVLVIDCEPINEAHGDTATIAAAAAQVGYRPVFSWMNTISSMVDLVAQGAIGTSAGFSQTLENQFNKILQNTGAALKAVALAEKDLTEKGKAMPEDEYLSINPDRRPIVVIDNFLNMGGNSIIFEKLTDWAALLVSANVAHVIFLTNDISFSKSLAKSLPDRVFRSIFLGDAAPESAKLYVLHHLDEEAHRIERNEKLLTELDESITALGGRLTDLEFLARRIKVGESPKQAVNEIIETSAAEILKLYFFPTTKKWAPEQAWYLVRRLSVEDELRYNEVLLHEFFKSGDEAVQALEQAELIAVVNKNGRPWSIRPGKPVYKPAFERLVGDNVWRAKMEYDGLKRMTVIKNAEIKACQEELQALESAGAKRCRRGEWLLEKMEKAQKTVDESEKEMGALKKILVKEF